jgi:hypothetical protein
MIHKRRLAPPEAPHRSKLMRRVVIVVLGIFLLATAAGSLIVAQTAQQRKLRRAQLPDFSKQPTIDSTFFKDVFSEALDGQRPADLGAPPTAIAGTNPSGGNTGSSSGSTPAAGGSGWSRIISSAALEDEIKAIKLRLDQEITTPTKFTGTGHKAARREFTIVAVMFGIIGEYDGDVRWKDVAPGARDAFARGAANAKVSTSQAYNEAKARHEDLGELVGGGSITAAGASEAFVEWPKVCDRSPLMQRLEAGHQGKLQMMTASAEEFKSNAEAVAHEANILAALGEILRKEGMEDADADDYAGWAKQITTASGEIVEAVKSNNYDQARKAVGTIGQACSQCHELYR